MVPQIAKAIQELLAHASIPATRQNTENLGTIHRFLDQLQSGELVVTQAQKPADPAPPAKGKK